MNPNKAGFFPGDNLPPYHACTEETGREEVVGMQHPSTKQEKNRKQERQKGRPKLQNASGPVRSRVYYRGYIKARSWYALHCVACGCRCSAGSLPASSARLAESALFCKRRILPAASPSRFDSCIARVHRRRISFVVLDRRSSRQPLTAVLVLVPLLLLFEGPGAAGSGVLSLDLFGLGS